MTWQHLHCSFLVLTTLVTTSVVQAQTNNAGIVNGLWYDQESFFANDTLRIYVAVRNNTGADLSGRVEFYVNGKQIERQNVNALDGRIIESWADWKPTHGTSTISALLSRTEISSTASGTQAVTVTSSLAEDVIFVDRDTDGDDIGNTNDTDDDNDGISDAEEIKNGTDPLVPNQPASDSPSADSAMAAEDEENEKQNTHSNDNTEGLEQYLTDNSRIDDVLTGITNFTDRTKTQLDTYRSNRTQTQNTPPQAEDTQLDPEENSEPAPESNRTTSSSSSDSTFGEITRTQNTEPGLFARAWTEAVNLGNKAYSGLLWLFSEALGRPMLIQILLLLLLFYSLIKIAKKFGARRGE